MQKRKKENGKKENTQREAQIKLRYVRLPKRTQFRGHTKASNIS
jgi:hypothetical protein